MAVPGQQVQQPRAGGYGVVEFEQVCLPRRGAGRERRVSTVWTNRSG